MTSKWPEPRWLKDIPESEREAACLRFHLNLAILYATPEMSNQAFTDAIGVSESAISHVKRRGRITGELAVAIENVTGREHFPREMFRPDLFTVSE